MRVCKCVFLCEKKVWAALQLLTAAEEIPTLFAEEKHNKQCSSEDNESLSLCHIPHAFAHNCSILH